MPKSISLQKNERKKYNKLVGIIVLVFLLCFASRLFVPAVSTDSSTKIGEIVKQDSRSYQLIERSYSSRDNRLEALILSPINSANALDELQVEVKKGLSDRTTYDTELRKSMKKSLF